MNLCLTSSISWVHLVGSSWISLGYHGILSTNSVLNLSDLFSQPSPSRWVIIDAYSLSLLSQLEGNCKWHSKITPNRGWKKFHCGGNYHYCRRNSLSYMFHLGSAQRLLPTWSTNWHTDWMKGKRNETWKKWAAISLILSSLVEVHHHHPHHPKLMEE